MRFRQCAAAALIVSTLLSGCTSYRGTNRLHLAKDKKAVETADHFFMRTAFEQDFKALMTPRLAAIPDDMAPGNDGAANQAQMRRMLNSGFSLVRLYCNEYFNEMGRNQRNSAVLRDLVKPVTDIVNMVIGLKLLSDTEDVNANLVTGFAGLSSAGVAGLNIYDRHFLFDNDNIAAVRTLTMNALAAHRGEVYKNAPDDVVLAIGQLQENENICTPAQILSNVRDAIKKGEFTAKSTGGGESAEEGAGEGAGEGEGGSTPPPPPPPPPPGTNEGSVPAGSENVAVSPGK